MGKYLDVKPFEIFMKGEELGQKSISLRIDSKIMVRLEMIAVLEDRSLSYVVKLLLADSLLAYETKHGPIVPDPAALERFRSRMRGHPSRGRRKKPIKRRY
jgi:hypothetical protein